MMDVASIILLVLNIISLGAVVLFSIFGVFELIFGPADAEKLLEKLHIPLNYQAFSLRVLLGWNYPDK